MKGKAVIPLVLGLGMGFVAIKMGVSLIKEAKGAKEDTIDVVVAARPIEPAALIDKSMLKAVAVPRTLIPPGAFTAPEAIIGRVSAMQVATGIPVSAEMLAPIGSEPGMPSQIPKGFRALSVKVDEATAVAGFAMPGHSVDIYAVETPKSAEGRLLTPISKLICEDVQVGAVGQSIKTVDPDGKTTRLTRSVTLYVRPDEIPAIDLASRGIIRMVLRGSQDVKKPDAKRLVRGLGEFLGNLASNARSVEAKPAGEAPPVEVAALPEPAPQPYRMEVVRGRETQEMLFSGPESSQQLMNESQSQGGPRPTLANQRVITPTRTP